MSHELRTPLNAIIGFSDLILEGGVGPISEQQREFLESVLRNGRHLLG
jgi:signal transduction histidine kinase